MPGGKCAFKEIGIQSEKYKGWLQSTSRVKADSVLRKWSLDISNMGKAALTSHLRSRKHKRQKASKD